MVLRKHFFRCLYFSSKWQFHFLRILLWSPEALAVHMVMPTVPEPQEVQTWGGAPLQMVIY